MPELIDRYATIDAIPAPTDADEAEYYGKVCDAIEAMPTIEPEVRHGRWNYRHEDDWCYCTVCGTDAEGSDGECLETDYCPHCGAQMDGGAENV